MTELEALLEQWLVWYRLRRAVYWAVVGLAGGLAASLGFVLTGMFLGFLLRDEFIAVLMIVSITSLLGAAGIAFVWPIHRQKAAQLFDRVFGLHERVSTAREMAQSSLESENDEISQRQLADTLSAARQVHPQVQLPLRVSWIPLVISVLLTVGAILTIAKGDNLFTQALQKRIIQQAITQETNHIEEILKQVISNPSLTAEQKEEIAQPLNEALQQLKEAQSIEQAVSALTSTEDKLKVLSTPESENQTQSLKDIGKSLEQAGGPLGTMGQKLAEGDTLAAAQQLANLDPGQLTAEEYKKLADQLEQTAAALESSSPVLAQQLQQAAQALKSGDTQTAQEALQQAAQALSQAGQQIAQGQTAAQAAQQASVQVGQGTQQLIQAGQNAKGGTPGQQAGSNQPGQGQGSGSSNQPGQGQSGSGAGQGPGGGDNVPGSETSSNPIDQGNGPGDGGETTYEPIYAPQHLGGTGSDMVTLPGSSGSEGQVIGQGNTQPGVPGSSSVPYIEVYPSYAEAYRQAIQSGSVPLSLRALVKNYFSSLEP